MKYCLYCEERVETEQDGAFLLCTECGSNLGPADGSIPVMFW